MQQFCLKIYDLKSYENYLTALKTEEFKFSDYEEFKDVKYIPAPNVEKLELIFKDTDFYLWEKMSVGTKISVRPVIGVKIPVINKKVETKS